MTKTENVYQQALDKLNGRQSKKVAHNTYLQKRESGAIALKYHATDVVTYHPDGSIVLDTGGWKTSTTKLRLNADYAMVPIRGIYSDKGIWWLDTGKPYSPNRYLHSHMWRVRGTEDGLSICTRRTWEGEKDTVCPKCGKESDYQHQLFETVPFGDGLTLRLTEAGYQLDLATIGEDPKKTQKLRRRVKAYSTAFVAAVRAGKVGAPGPGDCFYCQMRTVDTKETLGEVTRDRSEESHIRLHMEEKYYVPSLLVRALEVMGASQVMRWALASKWGMLKDENGKTSTYDGDSYTWQSIEKMLYRYLLRQLGEAA